MIFSKDGNFINEVSFNQDDLKNNLPTAKKNINDETESDEKIINIKSLK